jgi:hypothetical protein
MDQREIRFRANIKGTPILLDGFALYDSGMIGMHPETLESQLPEGYEYDPYFSCFIVKDGNVICEVLEGDEWIWIEAKNITVVQFTGLIDKASTPICEGDIRRFKTGIGIIVWADAAFAVKSPGSEAIDWEHSTVLIESEYLGNIFENHELINP